MNQFKTLLLVGFALTMAACGQNSSSVVQNIKVRSYEDTSSHETMVEMVAQLNSSNIVMPIATVTVVDPKNNNRTLGTINLETTIDGQSVLRMVANASAIKMGNYETDTKLPNGNPVPISGLTHLYALQDQRTKTKIYIGDANDKLFFGTAVSIKEFDGLAQYIPGSSMFFALPTASGVRGLAGFFTGLTSGTSGLGVFAQTTWTTPIGQASLAQQSQKAVRAPSSSADFTPSHLSKDQNWKMNYFFWNLNRRGTKLHLN